MLFSSVNMNSSSDKSKNLICFRNKRLLTSYISEKFDFSQCRSYNIFWNILFKSSWNLLVKHLSILFQKAYKIDKNLQRNDIELRFSTRKSFLKSESHKACILNLTKNDVQKFDYFAVFLIDELKCLNLNTCIACKLDLLSKYSKNKDRSRKRNRNRSINRSRSFHLIIS